MMSSIPEVHWPSTGTLAAAAGGAGAAGAAGVAIVLGRGVGGAIEFRAGLLGLARRGGSRDPGAGKDRARGQIRVGFGSHPPGGGWGARWATAHPRRRRPKAFDFAASATDSARAHRPRDGDGRRLAEGRRALAGRPLLLLLQRV